MQFANGAPKLLLQALAVIALSACSGQSGEEQYIGYIEADWVYVSSPQSGWIEDIPVVEGSDVKQGQLLFSLDTERERALVTQAESRIEQASAQERNLATGAREPEIEALEAQFREAQARLQQAQLEHDRIAPLVEEGIESRLRGDQVTANLGTAEAQVANASEQVVIAQLAARPADRAAARANVAAARADRDAARYGLRERTVEASRIGTVSEIFHQLGEFVSAGSPVVALLPQDGLRVRFFVPQEALPRFPLGRVVAVAADGLEANVSARVTYVADEPEFTPPVIYSRESRGKLVFLVEATLPPSPELHPGLPVDVTAP